MYREWYPARRLFPVLLAFGFVLVGVWLQVARLQVFYRDVFPRPPAASNAGPTHRGNILDRRGNPLTVDVFRYIIVLNPSEVGDEDRDRVRSYLLDLGANPERVEKGLRNTDKQYYPVIKDAPLEVVNRVRGDEEISKWLWVERVPVRFYPQGSLAAHVLGFVNWEPKPQGGVHAFYDTFLTAGRGLQPWGAVPAEAPGASSAFLPSPFHRDLVLTLDQGLQYLVERILQDAVGRYQARAGSIIVMDPRDGAILALANWPTFDPNRFYDDYDLEVWRNRAVSQAYEPGSVVKALTFAAALDAGVVTTRTTLVDNGVFIYAGKEIQNSDFQAHGEVTPREILALSLNVPTAEVGMKLGADRFYRYMRLFGLGQLTEVDLAEEVPGAMRRPGDPYWSPLDLATNAFGQALMTTPIQLIRAMAVLANGGRLVTPHVLKGYYLDDTYYEVRAPLGRRVIREETARNITQLLVGAVDYLSRRERLEGYSVAGKTGTAEIAEGREGYSGTDTNATFVGYLPAENPRVVILVYLERPQTRLGRWAANSAYPTFVRVAREAARLLHISPVARSD